MISPLLHDIDGVVILHGALGAPASVLWRVPREAKAWQAEPTLATGREGWPSQIPLRRSALKCEA